MPSWPLQQSIFAALSANAPLTALIGAGRIYDDVPQATPLPYVTFGPVTVRDWSTGTETGTEHLVALHIWSGTNGKKQAHAILAAVRAALHDVPLTIAGHRLVSLRHERSDLRRTPSGDAIHATVRFRAVTEPA